MTSNFLGGIWRRGAGDRRRASPPTPEAVREDWGWVGERAELFLRGAAQCCRVYTWDGLALLIRGYARPAGSTGSLDLDRIAEELRCQYLEQGELAVDGLDGSFTVALLDSQAERIVLYRNLVGGGSTYYRAGPEGLLFGGNLVELTDLAGEAPALNEAALAPFFLFRCVPGRKTLFRDVYRLLPGEQVSWDVQGLRRSQRHTFASLQGVAVRADEAVELVETTVTAVLADCAALRPESANLLSGGVDSSFLQAMWGRVEPGRAGLPTSWSVSVDHPHTWQDTDYALTASMALGTHHRLVPADAPYADYLLDGLASTGEPPNHVQSAYFGHLGRAMRAAGVTAGLCGEGADSLFGLGLANQVHNARTIQRLLPSGWLRSLAGAACRTVGWTGLARACRLASSLDDFGDLAHPVNQVAAFTDWEAARECFGDDNLSAAAAERRRLLDLYRIPYTAMDRLHAAGLLGEAVDSAGLWVTMFNEAGTDLLCPFLDSRVVRLALNLPPEARYPYRRPKDLLKRALARHAPAEIATRRKLGFGQPIFEWLAPGGQLSGLVDRLDVSDIVPAATLGRLRQRPTWFLYSLVVFDAWRKLFITRALPRPRREARHSPAPAVAAAPACP